MSAPGMAVHVCSLSAGETETRESLDSLASQLTELVSSSLREREALSHKIQWRAN